MFDFFKGKGKGPEKDQDLRPPLSEDGEGRPDQGLGVAESASSSGEGDGPQGQEGFSEKRLAKEAQAKEVQAKDAPAEEAQIEEAANGEESTAQGPEAALGAAEPSQPKKSWFGRLKRRLTGDGKEASLSEEPEPPVEAAAETPPELQLESEQALEVEPLAEAAAKDEKAEAVLEAEAKAVEAKAAEAKAAEAKAAEAKAAEAKAAEAKAAEAKAAEAKAAEAKAAEAKAAEAKAAEAKAAAAKAAEDKAAAAKAEPTPEAAPLVAEKPEAAPEEAAEEPEKAPKKGWLSRLKQKLANTRDKIAGRLEKALVATKEIDDDLLEELEEILITSDLGVKTTEDLLYKIRLQVTRRELKDSAALKAALRARLEEIIAVPARPTPAVKPLVIMAVGINGVGKTTTIAKLARRHMNEGRSVLLAAGDTFRAAAVEQLTIWAKRVGADIVAQPTGADPSAVVFDALKAAIARGIDVVIIDTAGRLHTKVNLMEELKKIKRVASKALPGAPHETILVLDANTGQNAASQARTFSESIGVDSLIVTKLDGTSKGGVVASIINELKLPVAYIGLGETFDDLRPFNSADFVEAIMGAKE